MRIALMAVESETTAKNVKKKTNMDYSWYSRQSLHEMLNEKLSKSRKECSRLHGSISKLKSGQAVLMTRRDRAKTDLESYVNKLSTALLDFQSEMLLTIREALSTKLNDLDKLREKYEESINSHLQLCNEAEKLTQFGRELESQVDKNSAVKILQKFKNMLDSSSVDGHFDDIMKLEFYPALQCTEIKPPMFGDLVVGRCYKSPTSALSALRARDCGEDPLSKVTEEKKSTKSTDMTTQTDDAYLQKSPITINNTEHVTDQNNNRSVITVSQPCSTYNRYSPLPGMDQPSVPISNRTSPPPGFHVFTPTINNMQANMQMNPYLLNNNYLCNTMPFVPQFPAVPVSPTYQALQVPMVYQFGDRNITSELAFKARQPSVPSYSATSQSVASCRVSVTSVASRSISASSVAPCSVSVSTVSSRSAKRNICDIPLPAARNSVNNVTNICDIPLPSPVSLGSAKRNICDIPLPAARNSANNVTMATAEKSCVRNIDFPDASACKTSASSTKKNSNILNETTDKPLGSTRKVVDDGSGDLGDKNVDHGKRKRYEVAAELFHSLVERTKELDLEENDNKIDLVHRTDECESSVKRCEPDDINDSKEVGDTGQNSSSELQETSSKVNEASGPHLNSWDSDKGRGIVQSGFCTDLRERIVKRQTISFDIKPLRKPFLQKTDHLLNSPNITKESSATALGKSVDDNSKSEVERSSTNCQTSNQRASKSMSSKPVLDHLNHTIEHKNVAEDNADPQAPGVLDISSHKVKTLRELVFTNYPPSKKEVEQKSKEMLLAQRSWFKGYMQKNLVENRKTDKKEDKKLVDEGWKDVKIKCENMEQTVSKLDLPHHESLDSFKDVSRSAVDDLKFDEKCKISDDMKLDVKSDQEGESVEVDTKIDGKSLEQHSPSHASKSDTKLNGKSLEPHSPHASKSDSSLENMDKEIHTEENVIDLTENDVQCNETEKVDTKKEETEQSTKETGNQLQDKSEAAEVTWVDAVHVQAEKVVEKKIESNNESTPRSKSDIKKDVCKRSPVSNTQKLGTLQAHWVARKGTNVKAKNLFTCSSDLRFPIGVTSNSSGDIIVTDTGNHCLKMFDSSGKFVKVFGKMASPSLRRPSDVVVNEFDNIYVKDDRAVRVFDQTGHYVKSIGSNLFSKPFGLVLTPTKCLLVLETDWNHPALVHISQDGSHVWKYLYTPLTTAPPNSKCRFMTVSENNVLVSDLGLSVVYITTFEGKFLRTVGRYGFGMHDFYEPSGLSVDIYGNVVIGDSKNNRVQVYRHDGSYTCMIEFDDRIVRPSGVHLTKDNKLVVVSLLQHTVKVYELL